jgi:hypothetical protein
MVATWLFQANPDLFDIDGFLATRPTAFSWKVTRQKGQIALGDQVFVWRAGGRGGSAASQRRWSPARLQLGPTIWHPLSFGVIRSR